MVTRASLLHEAARATDGQARPPAGPSDHVDGVEPAVVVEPATAADVAATMKWASAKALSVVIRGSGSKDAWGRVPRPVDVLLRTGRMNRLVAHEASDLTVTVEAGARLRDVNRQLARHGQCLPLDPPHDDATIGGVLATNHVGPCRHRYGTPRDLLIGMTIVMADGLVASSGGRVVKNVAGYDLGRLMAGSHGSLATIVSATFKLAPRPPASRTVRVHAPRPSDVPALVDLLRHHQCEAEAIEIHVSRRGPVDRVAVLVRYGSVAAAVDAACRLTCDCADQLGAAAESAERGEADGWWMAHQSVATGTGARIGLSWKPAEFERAAEALIAATRGADMDWIGRAAIGSGLIAVGGDPDYLVHVVTTLRANPVFHHVVLQAAPAAVRQMADVWAPSSTQQALWQALKSTCDPRDTFGAGRGPL